MAHRAFRSGPSPERRSLEDLAARLGVVVVAGVAALWAIVSLWWPYGFDHGTFSFVSDTIHRGGLPYRDVWDIKGPLVFYIFSVLQFGHQMWAVRVFDLLILGASCWAGAQIVAMFAGRFAAACTVSMMVLAFASFGNWYTAQPDGWAAHILVVVAALLILPGASSPRAALASLLIGACTTMKPSYAGFMLLIPLAIWPEAPTNRASAARTFALCTLAFLVPVAVAAAWFGARGALGDLVEVHLRFNVERMAADPQLKMPLVRVVQLALSILTSVPDLALAVPGAVLGAVTAFQRRWSTGVILVLWLAIALASIAVQRKFLFHNYSWHVVYPPVALMAGIGLGRLWLDATSAPLRPLRALVVATAAIVFYHTAKDPLVQSARWLRYAAGRISLQQYRATFEGPLPWLGGLPVETIGFSVTRDLRLGAYLRDRTAEDDEVYVWADPLVNHFSDRRSMTPITVPEAFTIWASESRRRKYRRDLIERMQSEHAAIIGVPAMALAKGGSPEYSVVTGFPELAEALKSNYEHIGAFDDVELYENKRWTTRLAQPIINPSSR